MSQRVRLHRVLCRNRIERNRPGLSHTVTGVASTPDELTAHVRSELDKWAPVVDAAGVRVN